MKIVSRPEMFTVIAGYDLLVAMEEAQDKLCQRNNDGTYNSRDICTLQRSESARGILGVELVKSMYGWTVRYDSGLQNFGIVAGTRCGTLDGTLEAAQDYAVKWVESDPERRYAWMRK